MNKDIYTLINTLIEENDDLKVKIKDMKEESYEDMINASRQLKKLKENSVQLPCIQDESLYAPTKGIFAIYYLQDGIIKRDSYSYKPQAEAMLKELNKEIR